MAIRTYLGTGDTFTVANNAVSVFGGAGTQTVLLQAGVTGTTFDANIERIELAGALNTYKFVNVAGTGLQIQDATGVVLCVVPSLNQAATLAFTDGSAPLIQTAGVYSLAGTAIVGGATGAATTASAAVVATTALAIGAGNVSTVAGTTTPAVTVPTFTVTGAAAAAEAATASYTVTLAGNNAANAYGVTATLAGTGGATTADYSALTLTPKTGVTLVNGVLSFAAGVTSAVLTSAVTADTISPETGEGQSVTLTAPTGTSAVLGTAAAVTTAITDVPVTYTLTASATSIYEGASVTYTLTSSAAAPTGGTSVAFSVVPGDTASANQGTGTTNLNDFSSGAFNPTTVVIAAGATTATYVVTPATDTLTELPESYSVKAVSGTTTLATLASSLLDGSGSVVAPNTGTTFTLTTGVDQGTAFTGTANNDTFVAGLSATAADNTLGFSDTLDGGQGTDSLNITGSVLAVDIAVPAATLTSIETINIRAIDADGTVGVNAVTVNAGNFASVTAYNSDRSSSNVTVTALPTGASVGLIGNSVVANGILSYAYATATADQIINISGGTVNTAVANITATASTGVTKATINSTGAANSVDVIKLDSAAANTVATLIVNAATNLTATLTATDFTATSALTVSGAAAAVDLGTAGIFGTIDASGLTVGGVSVGTGAITLTSFKGGQGNDTVTGCGSALTATVAGQVNAGAGTGDKLIVTAAAEVNSATKGAEYTGFEVLQNNAAADLDTSLIAGITSVVANQAGAGFTNMTATQAAAVRVLATDGTGTFGLATATGSSDVINFTLENATAAAAATVISLTGAKVAGFETMNVAVNSGISTAITVAAATGADQIAFTTATDLKSLVVTGAYDVGINAALATAPLLTTINASGLTGSTAGAGITLGANTGALTVTGSNNTDFVTLATLGTNGSVIVNTGAGDDTVTGTAAQIAAATLNGGMGTDTLAITDSPLGTINDQTFATVTGFEKIALTNVGAMNLTSGGFFNTAFATGVTITGGTVAATNAATIDLSTYGQAATATIVTANILTAVATTLKGGSGADTLTVTAAALTGAGGAGSIVINGGAGNDTISWSDANAAATAGVSVITGGTGADIINHTATGAVAAVAKVSYVTSGANDSTVAAYDQITGFVIGAAGGAGSNSDFLDLAGTATLAATATAAASGIASVTYSVSAAGLLTFAGTGAASLTQAQMQTIAALATATDGSEVAFTNGANSFVYHHVAATGDQMVELVAVAVTGLSLTTMATAGYVFAV